MLSVHGLLEVLQFDLAELELIVLGVFLTDGRIAKPKTIDLE